MPLFLLFVAMPIIEIALLIEVGERIGGWSTVGLVILTAAIGAFLVRQQGLATLMQARQKMEQGQIPGQEMLEGLMLAVAGVLLLTPGFITDTFGLLLVLPLTRPFIARWLMKRVKVVSPGQMHGQFRYRETRQDGSSSTIEGEYEVRDDDAKDRDRLPPDR
ncbi:FxsA family protein [Bowmanella dokdonensis]|uniref:Membrane protein FxsA n=1 Tax=Bowmanella dokdonensis TaxID=751969 RepID=A0A939IRY0_9ALTE|nr:FxsA family protein [Bowmanella dokdonensis]MBN7826127.1 membrane protein FxsA [Bowmanella dokdonensis]